MLNSGYFTSRHELMEWASRVAAVNLTRIEQLGSGNIYCQILDAAYPEKVPLNKVKWQAYLEVEFLHNFKVLQSSLQRLGISKDIDAQRLSKAKYQDNLEFIQWLKWHLSDKVSPNYDAEARRNHAQVYMLFTEPKPSLRGKQNKENSYDQRQLNRTQKSMHELTRSCNSSSRLLRKQNSFGKLNSSQEIVEKPLMQRIASSESFRKRNKLEVTLKVRPLYDKTNIIEEEQECF